MILHTCTDCPALLVPFQTKTAPGPRVDPETCTVKADGRVLTCEPATVLPITLRYLLF